jgi:serine/threonine protein phosphatase PrpC
MDGHLGNGAATFVQQQWMSILTEELEEATGQSGAANALEASWNRTCLQYQMQCSSPSSTSDECVAEYDPREGFLKANTGSASAIAGTTVCVAAYETQTKLLTFLNCGDSRAMLFNSIGDILLRTVDHVPEHEMSRFETAVKEGRRNYAMPECRMNQWRVKVGDYDYRVSRSLEGEFATSCGIIPVADIIQLSLDADYPGGFSGCSVVVATDGLWEVMDCEEVAKMVTRTRLKDPLSINEQHWVDSPSAKAMAKALCDVAIRRGTNDNVSCVVLFL